MTRFREWISALFDSESMALTGAKEPRHDLQPDLSKLELARFVRTRFYEDKAYARSRRRVWSARATLARVVVFLLSALGTIFLGVATLEGLAIPGFICSALVTTVSGLETFFNWRSRWVAADLALARWHDLEESLALYVSTLPTRNVDRNKILEYDEKRRKVWEDLSNTWITARRGN